MKRFCVYVVGLIVLLNLSAFGQGIIAFSGGGGTRDGGFQGNATFHLPIFPQPVLANAPYSGEQVSESSQTLADGTHITRPRMGPDQKTWRDSQGRVRMERSMGGGNTNLKDVPTIAQITDPVAGYAYIMDNVNHVAHRIKLAPSPQRPTAMVRQANAEAIAAAGGRAMTGVTGAPGAVGGGGGGGGGGVGGGTIRPNALERPQMSTEDLGTQTIDGVLVYGTRRTTVIPAGGRQGNDRPMTTTSDSWYSKDLRLTVLSTNFNPASGTSTNKIANLSTAEPDPALFMVPTDYTMVDETESFTITWGEKK
jgi:hypothetical protein